MTPSGIEPAVPQPTALPRAPHCLVDAHNNKKTSVMIVAKWAQSMSLVLFPCSRPRCLCLYLYLDAKPVRRLWYNREESGL